MSRLYFFDWLQPTDVSLVVPPQGFHGTVQTDSYALYEALEDDAARAREFLVLIGGLYLVEREAREGGVTPEARAALRREKVPALLERLHRRLLELEPGKAGSPVLLKIPLGKAFRYTLGHWEALGRYLEDGRYEIDTNLVEISI